jgi:hypothetical protein
LSARLQPRAAKLSLKQVRVSLALIGQYSAIGDRIADAQDAQLTRRLDCGQRFGAEALLVVKDPASEAPQILVRLECVAVVRVGVRQQRTPQTEENPEADLRGREQADQRYHCPP